MLTGMIKMRSSRVRVVAGIAAGVLLVAGCGGNDEKSASSAPPQTPRDQLLLTADEFPGDAKKVDLPKERLEAAAADLTGAQQNSTITPEECATTQADLSAATKDLLSDSEIIGATDEKAGLMFMEFVSEGAGDLATVRDGNAKCGEVTVTSTVEGRQISTVAKVENLASPGDLDGIDSLVYRSSSTSTVGEGRPLTSVAYMGMAVLRDTTVVVRVGALSDAVDQAVFDQLFLDAVRKVEQAD
ncbi:hypothetical protein DFR74_113164 [Nocardia puris]|uniref:Uncharacterized protein n=2 Tax=Nocardia puris TaxID=208602 RepID=A0A366D987_9NOCA|nr:hypothetical protein DFR74_113164 [Nocardia puris]